MLAGMTLVIGLDRFVPNGLPSILNSRALEHIVRAHPLPGPSGENVLHPLSECRLPQMQRARRAAARGAR